MQQYRKNLGKVSLTAEGVWDIKSKYDVLSIVYDEHTQHGFISKQPVPIGVDLYNSEYWMPLNVSGYTDSNIIILNKKTSDASIETYTLEEAVKSIASVGRKPGCILGFYNSNVNRLDIGGRWEIWQFNSTTISEWEDLSNWQNIYYNYNQFVGWYRNEEQLKINNPYPEIGCYAYVGNVLNEAVVYRCEIKHKWTETVQRAWDYVKIMIDGTVTVGKNGNWYNNGEDTGIPANVKGDPGLSPFIRYNTSSNKLEYSYDKVTWIECSDYISTWFRLNNNKLEMSRDNANWNPVSDYIAAWFRWQATAGDTQANNVGRIQMSRDNGKTWTNMSNDFTNNLHISRYIGVNESLPTSGIVEGTIYAKGPYYAEGDTLNDNPIYRLWVYAWKDNTLAWQDNGEFTSIAAGIVQEIGDSETTVMSQKVVSEKLSELDSKVGALNVYSFDEINYLFKSFFISDQEIDAESTFNGWINKNDGSITEEDNFCTSVFNVSPNSVYIISSMITGAGGSSAPLAFYDSNNKFICAYYQKASATYSNFIIFTPFNASVLKVSGWGDYPKLYSVNDDYSNIVDTLKSSYTMVDNSTNNEYYNISSLFIEGHFINVPENQNMRKQITKNKAWKCLFLKVFKGQIITFNNVVGGNNGRAYGLYNTNYNYIKCAEVNAILNESITIEQDGYLIVNTNNFEATVSINTISLQNVSIIPLAFSFISNAKKIEDNRDAINTIVSDIEYPFTNGYINISEGYEAVNLTDTNWNHSGFIRIFDYSVFEVDLKGSSSGNVALVSFYKEANSRSVITDYTINSEEYVGKITKPSEDTNYVRFCGASELFGGNYKVLSKSLLNKEKNIEKTIGLIGASFAYKANGWFEYASEILGFTPINLGISGTNIQQCAVNYDSWLGSYVNKMDALVIMYTHNYNCFEGVDLKDNLEDYVPSTSMSMAAGYDYVIKRYIADCLSIHKNPTIILCTNWHNGRKTFNDSVRKLAEKWSFPLVEFDKNTLSATMLHPTLADSNGNKLTLSVLNALTPPDHPTNIITPTTGGQGCIITSLIDGVERKYDAEVIDGKIVAWHPDRRYKSETEGTIDNNNDTGTYPHIQQQMGKLLAQVISSNLN